MIEVQEIFLLPGELGVSPSFLQKVPHALGDHRGFGQTIIFIDFVARPCYIH
jgi:hypothetical protein